ncbi:flagellar biosynthetic protein FliO [Pantoea sp. SOD02]|uniref:flagellar biosynthetic protein FliO n=1 Tax=Pantoea sp. SOD02 TaxID=2970818 RepID=UPI00215766F5|nr:flagellar biosynthetic protein FliO [Pantoea sp. SOD02]UVC29948.1 flagellar biosynthetic protein FliO [Pantoea sp. SOD02]
MNSSAPLISARQASDTLPSDSLLMTVTGALVLVILLMVTLAWLFRRSGLTRRLADSQGAIHLVASKSLGARERVVLVDIGEQRLVLGVTATQINCLATQARPIEEAISAASAAATFPAILETLRQKYRKDAK